jgi:hypothetical protein
VKEISFALPCCEMRKNVFNRTLASQECRAEVVSKSHCGTENCERCRVEDIVALPSVTRLGFHSRETGGINFSQLPGPKQGVIPCSIAISCNSQQCSLKTFFLSRSVEILGLGINEFRNVFRLASKLVKTCSNDRY